MDANTIVIIIVAVITSSPGIAALILQNRREKRTQPIDDTGAGIRTAKDAADTVSTYAKENRQLNADMDQLRKELHEVRMQLNQLQDELTKRDDLIAEWSRGIRRLIGQLTSHDMTPVWQPGVVGEGSV